MGLGVGFGGGGGCKFLFLLLTSSLPLANTYHFCFITQCCKALLNNNSIYTVYHC